MPISLLLLTHNSSLDLTKHFGWLKDCQAIDEIVVVDDNSTDNTKKIVDGFQTKKRSIKFFSRGLENDFSAQRNFALSKTKNDWVLWLDPDEQPEEKLIRFLGNIDTSLYNYAFKRPLVYLNNILTHGESFNVYITRLFNKNHGQFAGLVHETWQSSKPVVQKDLSILHYSIPNLKAFLEKINFYSTLRAQELFNQKVKTNLFQIIFYPKAKFIQNYIFRLGFLDFTPGIIIALCMSFHSFLVRSKLWHLSQK
ncbi:MAG: glycosyltransferase family 2 protein [Candidatus Shapirobacteria bacterium]